MPKSVSTLVVSLLILIAPAVILPLTNAGAGQPAESVLEQAWERTELPVATGQASRTWLWGPEPLDEPLREDSGSTVQTVLYYDKGRMEYDGEQETSTSPASPRTGAIIAELIDGTDELDPAQARVAGDANASAGLRYGALGRLTALPPFNEGEPLMTTATSSGDLIDDASLADYGVTAGELIADSGHRVASVFWDFLNSSGVVWNGVAFVEGPLFPDPLFPTGQPLTEAYWLHVPVGGVEQDVMFQCFERRCLTYTPANPPGWRVESNNAGAHYFEWRSSGAGDQPSGEATVTPDLAPEYPVAVFETTGGELHSMALEVAATISTRACGLMHRMELGANSGMLFVWEEVQNGSFWNCNTFVPLTLAWIDADGEILGLTDMAAQTPDEPQEVISYPSPAPFYYVIEANQGWFAERGIAAGDSVDLEAALARGDTGSDTLCRQLGLACGE